MNREQMKEIRERAEAATEGPWVRERDWHEMGQDAEPYPDSQRPYGVSRARYSEFIFYAAGRANKGDAEFIAHSREDIPALLAHIDQLTERLVEERAGPPTGVPRTDEYFTSKARAEIEAELYGGK
jgi:hypothetical protein